MTPYELSDLRRRLAEGHQVDEVSGCWVWQRATSVGYGRIKYDGRLGLAHRASYEPVTRSVNMLRAQPFIDRPDRCLRGHEHDYHVNPSGQRQCRSCKALTARRRRLLADIEARLVLIDGRLSEAAA